MTPETKARTERFKQQRNMANSIMDELFAKTKTIFGKNVTRTRSGVSILFSKHHDEEFATMFGPMYTESRKLNPNAPPVYDFSASFYWDEECEVIQTFQACQDAPKYCREGNPKGSEISIKNINGHWRLTSTRGYEEWKQQDASVETVLNINRWLLDYLDTYDATQPIGVFEVQLIKATTHKTMSELSKLQQP